MAKYDKLRDYLLAANEASVELSFAAIADLVGGLPASAYSYSEWWANQQGGSRAPSWLAAGRRVETVSLSRQRVRFSARAGTLSPGKGSAENSDPIPVVDAPAEGARESVNVAIRFEWATCGSVTLDEAGKPRFPKLPSTPGLYRFSIQEPGGVSAVYIGETDNLRRRGGNYRNPGPSQRTSIRLNAILRKQLGSGSVVRLDTATAVTLELEGAPSALDLGRKASRLLAENAALVTAVLSSAHRIENLP